MFFLLFRMSRYEIVRSKGDLQDGDHVSMPSEMSGYSFQHHAIVVSTPKEGEGNLFKIIHVATAASGISGISYFTSSPSFSSDYYVREHTLDFTNKIRRGVLLRYLYAPGECKNTYDVIKSAIQKIGKFNFDARANNCEHFARWCKTGNSVSYQAQTQGGYY